MRAWLADRSARCPSCGTVDDDWIDEHQKTRVDSPFEATPMKCYGCAELAAAAEEIPQGQRRSVRVVFTHRRPADG